MPLAVVSANVSAPSPVQLTKSVSIQVTPPVTSTGVNRRGSPRSRITAAVPSGRAPVSSLLRCSPVE